MKHHQRPAKRPVVILTVPFGSAHTRTAEAIRQAWNTKDRPTELQIAAMEDYLPHAAVKALVSGYLTLVRRMPWLFQIIYSRAREPGAGDGLLRLAVRAAKPAGRRLMEFIGEYPPLWLSTHPLTSILAEAARTNSTADPQAKRSSMAVLVTDFHFHAFWCFPTVRTYFVGRPAMKRSLVARGIPQSYVRLSGIPIDPVFHSTNSRNHIEETLGLPKANFRILLMGGGLGIGPIERIASQISSLNLDLQLIVVAGSNRRLRHRLSGLGKNTRVYGYVDTIHALMAVSDLCLTKPGGLTIAEAATAGLPALLFGALPGHEEANSETLVRAGAAYRIGNPDRVGELVTELLKRPGLLKKMGRRMRRFGKPHAAFEVADALEDMWSRVVR